MVNERPTDKQINFATDIAGKLHKPLPEERTKQAYAKFISDNINAFKRAKQSYFIDEDTACVYGMGTWDI